jgi:hypothetical protein
MNELNLPFLKPLKKKEEKSNQPKLSINFHFNTKKLRAFQNLHSHYFYLSKKNYFL